jgi:hypothetical protein
MIHSVVWRAFVSYLTVTLATVAGIIGMGLVFTAVTRGPGFLALTGLPLLLAGLYWAGGALARSMLLSRRRHASGPERV